MTYLGRRWVGALALFRIAQRVTEAFDPSQTRAKDVGGKGGKWVSMASRVAHAIASGEDAGQVLGKLNRRQLTTVAKAHGIETRGHSDPTLRRLIGERVAKDAPAAVVPQKKPAAPRKARAAKAARAERGVTTGSDLTGDRATADAAVAAGRGKGVTKKGVGRHGDERMQAIAAQQGFDGAPHVVSRAEMDRLIAGGQPAMYRGISDSKERGKTKPGSELAEQYRTGEAYQGPGVYGNGTYITTHSATAEYFSRGGGGEGAVMRMTLHPKAKVVDYETVSAEHKTYLEKLPKGSAAREAFGDLGRYAMARGYDAIEVRDVPQIGLESGSYYNVLNRTAVVVEQ